MDEMKQNETPVAVVPQRIRGRPFGPDNKPKGGSKKGRRFVRACPLLRDLRRIFCGRGSAVETPGQVVLRELLAKKPRWVFRLWSQMERTHEAAVERLRREMARAAG